MKVLFAVNNEKVSESIIKTYQLKYKEIIASKNVYYFNAIIKELQKDKSYDRVVISEDLEPYSNKNYDMIDKFLFEKLDSISDEASNNVEGEIPIVLIATDRREKSDPMLLKLFSIGVYSTLIGTDRTVENVCQLINTPRNKKEAKLYYRVGADDADYKPEGPEDVSETEIQNIINHYKRLGKNEDRYIESFNSIASQYTDGQLKIISKFLPLNVRAVLEESCPKYQEVMVGSVKGKIKKNENDITTKNIKPVKNSAKIELIDKALEKPRLTNPVVIPSTVDINNVRKVYADTPKVDNSIVLNDNEKQDIQNNNIKQNPSNDVQVVAERRGRGRPSKEKEPNVIVQPNNNDPMMPVIDTNTEINSTVVKKGRGRPKKQPIPAKTTQEVENIHNTNQSSNSLINNESNPQTDIDLFNLANSEYDEEKNNNTKSENSTILPGVTDYSVNNKNAKAIENNSVNNRVSSILGNNEPKKDFTNYSNKLESTRNETVENSYNNITNPYTNKYSQNYTNNNEIMKNNNYDSANLSNLLTSDKKIAAFVGTSKNGTSFLVNNLALLLSSKGIKTAILDLTKNKNAYYIFTQNDENLRTQAFNCISGLRSGVANGISINKNLTVYTTKPDDDDEFEDYGNILQTLAQNYSLILLDCDFNTDYHYFAHAQELYLVQTYDILTIQPLTAFLRELLSKEALDQNKIRIIINKALKVRNLTEKMIVGGISRYNDPSMSYMTELFNKDTAIYTTIPFEDQTYAKYLESLATCELSLAGYSKGLLESLSQLGNMVYPLISNNNNNKKQYNNYNKQTSSGGFNSNIDNTLNKMRNNFN